MTPYGRWWAPTFFVAVGCPDCTPGCDWSRQFSLSRGGHRGPALATREFNQQGSRSKWMDAELVCVTVVWASLDWARHNFISPVATRTATRHTPHPSGTCQETTLGIINTQTTQINSGPSQQFSHQHFPCRLREPNTRGGVDQAQREREQQLEQSANCNQSSETPPWLVLIISDSCNRAFKQHYPLPLLLVRGEHDDVREHAQHSLEGGVPGPKDLDAAADTSDGQWVSR